MSTDPTPVNETPEPPVLWWSPSERALFRTSHAVPDRVWFRAAALPDAVRLAPQGELQAALAQARRDLEDQRTRKNEWKAISAQDRGIISEQQTEIAGLREQLQHAQAGTGDTATPDDVIEQAAQIAYEATNLEHGRTWDAYPEWQKKSARKQIRALADAGLLADRPDTRPLGHWCCRAGLEASPQPCPHHGTDTDSPAAKLATVIGQIRDAVLQGGQNEASRAQKVRLILGDAGFLVGRQEPGQGNGDTESDQ